MENNSEAQLYNHVNQLLAGHEKLLSDATRNQIFYQALAQNITRVSSVLDIGSGTGVWAITAAKLGAQRVVAIEQDHLLIGLINTLARENGVAERVEAIQGEARQVQLDREFDIVISETIGHLVFDEQIAEIMMDARTRFLKPGGALIPASVALVAAPVRLDEPMPKLPAGIPVEYGYFESLLLHRPVGWTDKTKLQLLGEPRELIRADLARIEASPKLNDLTARWEMHEAQQVNGFAVWATATLADGVHLTTLETSSWSPLIYRVHPFAAAAGELTFKLTLTNASNYWTATLANAQTQETQSYSPAMAATALLAQSRANVNLLNHLQRFGQSAG